jgi:hypothetical protein
VEFSEGLKLQEGSACFGMKHVHWCSGQHNFHALPTRILIANNVFGSRICNVIGLFQIPDTVKSVCSDVARNSLPQNGYLHIETEFLLSPSESNPYRNLSPSSLFLDGRRQALLTPGHRQRLERACHHLLQPLHSGAHSPPARSLRGGQRPASCSTGPGFRGARVLL